MAKLLKLLLVMVAVVVKKNEALGGIAERFQRLHERTSESQNRPSYNENVDELDSLIKTDTLKALCESGKVNAVWCQYKQLLDLNSAYEQHQKSVQKKSAGIMCWPGLPLSCKGLLPSRLARAAEKEEVFDNRFATEHNNGYEAEKHNGGIDNARSGMDTDIEYEGDSDDDKRGMMKCRPGMINCRRRKGKRTLAATYAPKHCPQGWMFCL